METYLGSLISRKNSEILLFFKLTLINIYFKLVQNKKDCQEITQATVFSHYAQNPAFVKEQIIVAIEKNPKLTAAAAEKNKAK